jgi:hypothetical protein
MNKTEANNFRDKLQKEYAISDELMQSLHILNNPTPALQEFIKNKIMYDMRHMLPELKNDYMIGSLILYQREIIETEFIAKFLKQHNKEIDVLDISLAKEPA